MIEVWEATLILDDEDRFKPSLPATRDRHINGAAIGQNGFASRSIAVVTGFLFLRRLKMLINLGVEDPFGRDFPQLAMQPAGTQIGLGVAVRKRLIKQCWINLISFPCHTQLPAAIYAYGSQTRNPFQSGRGSPFYI
jgi:hypothetical protein